MLSSNCSKKEEIPLLDISSLLSNGKPLCQGTVSQSTTAKNLAITHKQQLHHCLLEENCYLFQNISPVEN